MAELSQSGGELLLTLTAVEKAESLHGDLRVPMSSVREVDVVDDIIRAVHGLKFPGTRWPGRVAVGRIVGPLETKTFGKTFAVIHHDTPQGVRVRLANAAFDQLLIGCNDPVAVKRLLGELR